MDGAMDYPTDEGYVHWWANEYELQSSWWPPSPPEPSKILEKMRHRALGLLSTAPILEPSVMVRQDKRHADLAAAVIDQGGSSLHARAAVRHEIERSFAINRSNELFEDPPMRRGTRGIGYHPPVLEKRQLYSKELWDRVGKPSKFIQLFSWNAGNLQRSSDGDTLNDLLASQFHIACLQEATILAGQQILFDSRGIRSEVSRDRESMINAGGTGLKVIRKCHKESAPHCDMVHRPAYYGDTETNAKKQCLWYLCADIAAFDGDGTPVDRGGQYMWRVCTVHLDHDHAKKRRDVRQTLADFLSLMMRDKVDIITGDFNQGAYVLGEVMTRVMAFYESEHSIKVNWFMPKPYEEIRTIIISWPAYSDASLTGPKKSLSMMVKPLTTFEKFNAEDFGLRPNDHDAHCPSFCIIRKSRIISHADLHQRSEAGKKRDAERRKEKKRDKKRART